jgi:acyl carrier protein
MPENLRNQIIAKWKIDHSKWNDRRLVFNSLKQNTSQVSIGLDSPLFGSESQLDSLDLINLIVGLEKVIEENYDQIIVLADDRALSQDVSPFTSISTLSEYIDLLLLEAKGG